MTIMRKAKNTVLMIQIQESDGDYAVHNASYLKHMRLACHGAEQS